MRPSRGMGAMMPSKIPRAVRRGDSEPIKKLRKGGLYDNIWAKRKRIAAGIGEKMRKPGTSGAPTAQAFRKSAKTAK